MKTGAFHPLFGLALFACVAFAQTSPYPGFPDTAATLGVPADNVSSALTAQILLGDTTAQVANAVNIPRWSLITFGGELAQVCLVTGNVLTFGTPTVCPSIAGRGLSGTTVAPHALGVIGFLNMNAWYHLAQSSAIIAVETALTALAAPVVGHPLAFPIGEAVSGAALTTAGRSFTLRMPYACTIRNWSLDLGAGDTGTVGVRLWKKANGTAIPTVADVINSADLALSTGTSVQSAVLTAFTNTVVAANDRIIMAVTAITGTIHSVVGVLDCQ